jgi:ABC-2 type transport system permease protein
MPEAAATTSLWEQLTTVAGRSLKGTLRQRRLLIAPLLFPLILFAINSSALSATTKINGFPDVPYKDFALALPFLMAAMLNAVGAGTNLAHDIETGFLRRLSLTPMHPSAMLVGQLAGALTLSLAQGVLFVLIGLLAGVHIAAGVGGALVLLALAVLIAFTFSTIGALLAIRTGSGAAVQGFFPLLFVTIFLSSSFLPRNVISVGWFHTIATYNPISYLVEGMRSLIITGWNVQALELGFGLAAGIALLALALANSGIKTRMVTA